MTVIMTMNGNSERIFTNPASKWTMGQGPDSDIVISSRVRLARNLEGRLFPAHLRPADRRAVAQQIVTAMSQATPDASHYTYYPLDQLSTQRRQVLLEKHLISPLLLEGKTGSGVMVRDDEGVAVMVNEEDHLRIQCFLPALQLREVWQQARELEKQLARQLPFAFHREFGYLTACPTNVGTGLRASAMVHLPGLVLSKQADGVFASLSPLGLTVRGIYGEGSKVQGNLFQISNQVTLGRSEEEIISRLQEAVSQVVTAEREARQQLREQSGLSLEDHIWRSYGVLRHGRSLASQEMMERLSLLRLGMDLGWFPGLTGDQLNRWLIEGQSGFLQVSAGENLSPALRDWQRAALLRRHLASIKVNDA